MRADSEQAAVAGRGDRGAPASPPQGRVRGWGVGGWWGSEVCWLSHSSCRETERLHHWDIEGGVFSGAETEEHVAESALALCRNAGGGWSKSLAEGGGGGAEERE